MLTCGDFWGAFWTLANNTTNPLTTLPAVIFSPLLAFATLLASTFFAISACFQ